MPKLKSTPAELAADKLLRNIKALMGYYGITKEELAVAARVTERTICNRFQSPQDFTFTELAGIAPKLNVTLEELFSDNPLAGKNNDIKELKGLLAAVLKKGATA